MTDYNPSEMPPDIRQAEADVEAHSRVFSKQLGLRDLVLTQILYVVGLGWVGAAAKLGSSHVIYWLLAIVLFYLPSAVVVMYLNRLMPLEGGLYQWAKLAFNDAMGFLVAWNLWIFAIVLTSEIGVIAATNLAYALGADWIAGSKWFMTLAGFSIITALGLVSIRGLAVGKWVHNAGGFLLVLMFVALIALPFLGFARPALREYHPLSIAMPAVSLLGLNILGKMGFGALGGFEYVAIFAGECRDPGRAIGRSVVISAPVIAAMFILGTSSVLSFVRPEDVDLIGPIPQVLSLGTRSLGIAAHVVQVVIFSVLTLRLAQASVHFSATSRLPMVAGWDHLLPEWFTRLHPRFKTPANSILFVAAMTFAFSLAGTAGVGQQEAFQLFQSAAVMFYGFTYLVMFAIPLIAWRRIASKPPLWLRIAALSGFAMTLLNLVLSIFPIIPVSSQTSFTAKIVAVIVAANLVGAGIYMAEERRWKKAEIASRVLG